MHWKAVALLAEGVDRNIKGDAIGPITSVALLAEGVDRNPTWDRLAGQDLRSPSSRRAWIEIIGGINMKTNQNSRPPRGGRG